MRCRPEFRLVVRAALVLGLAVTILPGWLVIKRVELIPIPGLPTRTLEAQSVSQLDVVGDVQVTTTLCGSNGDAVFPCPNGNSGQQLPTGGMQFLLGYRILATVQPPDSFTASADGTAIVFASSPSYASQLAGLSPPPAGEKVGGLSPPSSSSTTLDDGEGDGGVSPIPPVARGADGSPFGGPLPSPDGRRRPYVARGDTTRPVRCGATQTTPGDLGLDVVRSTRP